MKVTLNIIASFPNCPINSKVLLKSPSAAEEVRSPPIAGAVTGLPPTKLTPEDTRLDVEETES